MMARTLAVALLLTLVGGAVARTQATPTLRFISPPPGVYVTGPVLLKVGFDGDGGGSAIDDVTFFADGKQICVASGARMECEWDAGPTVSEHALRAVARLRTGGRVVANGTDACHRICRVNVGGHRSGRNVVITDGGRFVKGLTKDAFRLLDDKEERPILGFDPNGAPLELVLALDVSGSMKDALPDVQEAARSFLNALGPNDRVTVLGFNDSLFTLAPREADLEIALAGSRQAECLGRHRGLRRHHTLGRSALSTTRAACARGLH